MGGKTLLTTLFGNSPFLGNCVIRDPNFFMKLVSQPLKATFDGIIHNMDYVHIADMPITDLMSVLRQKKHHTSLLTAVADIMGFWLLEQVTSALSVFAERATQLVVSRLLADQAATGNLELPWQTNPESDDPATASGYAVLGMGKLGGHELNYSSDIDLIVLYDDELMHYTGNTSLGECMIQLTRELVRILQTRTADGYVFRTDLRLRPDPRATPPALSMAAAEVYYESVGLNWERSAMIKARPIAGDKIAGHDFLSRIAPFIWRKHLDFAAVQDIRAIKHQIHNHHGFGDINILGHDVKIGRGGIREIEFIAQAHQLISGGRDVRLRGRETCKVLITLTETGHMKSETAQALVSAYRFLRSLEHRIQMVNDEQRHDLPATLHELAQMAIFMGFEDVDAFTRQVLFHLHTVQNHYDTVFEVKTPTGKESLVDIANAGENDETALNELTQIGFVNPKQALATTRRWRLAPYRALRHERARSLLSGLIPTLLGAVRNTADPDGALRRFDDFLGVLPEGVQLFSLLNANPWILNLLAEIMGSAPRLAAILGRNIGLLDSVLGAEFLTLLPGPSELAKDLEHTLERARDYQDILDLSRAWANDQRFRVGVQVLRNTAPPSQASLSLSNLADVVIQTLMPRVITEFANQHGTFPESDVCVLALGKLGGREMTFTSDLDLVFLYQVDGADQSDGPKPLAHATYFARLFQRFINALAAPTCEGRLYEVDMRLRPSGQAGPLAQTLGGFTKYHHENAWTWEHMALTRARVVVAEPEFNREVDAILQKILTLPRGDDSLIADVAEMRTKVQHEHGVDDLWAIKYVKGGITDLEFVTQYLQLKYASQHPNILNPNTNESIRRMLISGVISPERGRPLIRAAQLFTALQSLLRLCTEDRFDETSAPPDLKMALTKAGGASDFVSLKQHLQDAQAAVYSYFEELIGQPENNR